MLKGLERKNDQSKSLSLEVHHYLNGAENIGRCWKFSSLWMGPEWVGGLRLWLLILHR